MKKVKLTDEQEQSLFDAVSSGSSVTAACQMLKVSEATVYRMMARDKVFAEKMTAARAAQQDYEVDQCILLADNATPEDWQVVKLRIWARQWRAAKLAPKKYGEKIEQTIQGAEGGPVRVELIPLA